MRLPAGSGVKGSDYAGGQKGAAQLLNSPWDLALDRCAQRIRHACIDRWAQVLKLLNSPAGPVSGQVGQCHVMFFRVLCLVPC